MVVYSKNIRKPAIFGGDPLFDSPIGIVRPQFPTLDDVAEPLNEMLRMGQLTNHWQYVPALEAKLNDFLEVPFCVAVSNGTLGLVLVLAGLRLTGEVIVPSFTYSATAHALWWAGLKPVFADICPDTFTLSVEAVEAAITPQTSAILAVHVYGHPCDIDRLQQVARRYGLALIFDAAHAFGATYRGTKVGNFGDAEVFSFHATKLFPVGEGGGVATRNLQLAEYVALARKFGDPGTENTLFPGLNAKMQEFNALLGLKNLETVPQAIENRRCYAKQFKERLGKIPGLRFQIVQPGVTVTYQNLAIVVDPEQFGLSRDQLNAALKAENIATRKYFHPPLHRHDAYADGREAHRESLVVTEEVASKVLCLPIYSAMSEDLIDGICRAIDSLHQWAHISAPVPASDLC